MEEKRCEKCSAVLNEGQVFCPECGSPVEAVPCAALQCAVCAAPLAQGQQFCPNCGLVAEPTLAPSAISDSLQYSTIPPPKKMNVPLIASIAGGAILLVVVLVFALSSITGVDFNSQFSDFSGETWCSIAKDGSYMKIDTNPLNKDDYTDFEAYGKVEEINERLGFTASLYQKMGQTRSLDGRVTDENEKIKVSWTYHPDKGLEVMYEKRK